LWGMIGRLDQCTHKGLHGLHRFSSHLREPKRTAAMSNMDAASKDTPEIAASERKRRTRWPR
jgi:hypothetical protein